MEVAANEIGSVGCEVREGEDVGAIVRQHIGMVYSAALRRVGRREMAEDVTQAVFIVLAKRRGRWPGERYVGAWLMKTVKYAAANAMKMEARRRKHEAAAARAGVGACSCDPSEVIVWQEISARLDDAVMRLPAGDRNVVLLRYFQGRSIREIAREMYVSEVAVRVRLHRAIEKLRRKLDRDGACVGAISGEGFAGMLEKHASGAAPAALSASVCAAIHGGGQAGAALLISRGVSIMMNWSKVKVAVAVVGVVVGVGAVLSGNRMSARAAEPDTVQKENAPAARVGSDMSHVVKFDVGATYLLDGDDITIDEIHGTSDRIEAGNLYEIKGTYKLATHDKAMLAAFTTSSQGKGIPTQKTQTTMIDKGSGHFTVYQYIWYDGNPHISFYPADGGESFAAVYFGTGSTLLKHMTWKETDAKMSGKTTR